MYYIIYAVLCIIIYTVLCIILYTVLCIIMYTVLCIILLFIDLIYFIIFLLSLFQKFCLFIICLIIFISIVDVKLTPHEIWDHRTLYIQSPQGTTSDLPGWMESQWIERGPRDKSGGYLTFSLASFLLLLLILSGDIELNPGPPVKY